MPDPAVARTAVAPLPITLSYPTGNPGRLVNTGHTVDLYLQNPATLRVADTTFTYREIHFHVPAEHLVQGVRHAAEIHAVHVNGDMAAVLTTFVTEDQHNSAWNVLIDSLPGNKGDTLRIGPTDLMTLLALRELAREPIYSYAGSLTTPACSPTPSSAAPAGTTTRPPPARTTSFFSSSGWPFLST